MQVVERRKQSVEGTGISIKESPMPLAIGTKVKVFDVDDHRKTKGILAYGVIVNLAGATLHGRVIEEGNVSMTINSIVSGSEVALLYEANNNDDPLDVVHLRDALNSVTKWPMEALAPSNE